ncbi:MAG: excinuclease ABC subunit UvrC [Candidatus Coatesbacteria bacterium]|nr:excinuclease ABC subunit UvrC [Candidatus Coatesbacteria bacterium]
MNKNILNDYPPPSCSGCYLYYDNNELLLYIGKAKRIDKRVASYFTENKVDEKTRHLVKRIHRIEYIITDNEWEALLLESELIQKHKPPYNISLREGNRYAYIKITNEKFPRILSSFSTNSKDTFYGPYPNSDTRKGLLSLIYSLFKFRTCNILSSKACINLSLGKCCAPCVNKVSEETYNEYVKKAKQILTGGKEDLKKVLIEERDKASANLEYEKALLFQKQLEALETAKDKQKVIRPKGSDKDFVIYLKGPVSIAMVFQVKRGVLQAGKHYLFRMEVDSLDDFLIQYYTTHTIPEEIVIGNEIEEVVKIYLEKQCSGKLIITIPKRGYKKKLLSLVEKNAFEKLGLTVLKKLKDSLNLTKLPATIECYDISTLQGFETVASRVVFYYGHPLKEQYRKYKIKTVEGQNDFQSLVEVLDRRFSRSQDEPDLLVIDGGKPQLREIYKSLKERLSNINVISLAKEEEMIYRIDKVNPIKLSLDNPGLQLLQRIRDEAHRFAVAFHRQRRKKSLFK